MATQSLSRIRSYAWQKVYLAAVLEIDDARLEKRIAIVEKSLLLRLLELTNRPVHKLETEAILDALKAMRTLKRERLGL